MRRGCLLIVLVGALGCGLKPYSSGTEGGGVSGGTSGTAMGGEGTSGGGGGDDRWRLCVHWVQE